MRTQHLTFDDHRCLVEVAEFAAEHDATKTSWIDLTQYNHSELMQHLGRFSLHQLVLEAVDKNNITSHIGYYQEALLLQLPALDTNHKRTTLSMVIVGEDVITIHESEVPILDQLIRRCKTTPLRSSELAILVYEILNEIIDETIEQTLVMRRRADEIEEASDKHANQFNPTLVFYTHRAIVSLEAVLQDLHHCLARLQTLAIKRLQSHGVHEYSSDLISQLEHAIRVTERLEDRLTVIQQHYTLRLQERQNQKLNVLALVSTVFLPLTLITGIYGMNFRYMPELKFHYGYPLVLVTLVVIGVGLVCLLKKKGWFK